MGSALNDNGLRAFTTAEAIKQYARVKLNSSGLLLEADADDKGIGTAQIAAASGGACTVRLWNKEGTHKVIANAAFSRGDLLYGHDDGEVDDDPDYGVAVGIALEAATASGDIVEIVPLMHEHTGLIYANRANSDQVENTTVETAFNKSKTIDGGELQVGDVLEVIARAWVEDNNSTDTLTLKLYFGTEMIVTTGAVDVADNDIGYIHAFIVVRAVGASGIISASGLVALGVPGTVTAKPWRKAPASEDLSGDVAITVKATWSAAHADNEVELEDLIVIKHRQ